MRIKINLKAGGHENQHNQTVVGGLRVKSGIKAGGRRYQHNQAVRKG
jgi:hypothetical protein